MKAIMTKPIEVVIPQNKDNDIEIRISKEHSHSLTVYLDKEKALSLREQLNELLEPNITKNKSTTWFRTYNDLKHWQNNTKEGRASTITHIKVTGTYKVDYITNTPPEE